MQYISTYPYQNKALRENHSNFFLLMQQWDMCIVYETGATNSLIYY